MTNPYGPNCKRLWDIWPDVKLDATKGYWFGKVPVGQDPPAGKVIRYSRNDRYYLIETKG